MSTAMVAQFKLMKGFFKQKPVGEYLIFSFYDKERNAFLIFQFFRTLGTDLYLSGVVGAARCYTDDNAQVFFDRMRHDANVTVLEDNLEITITFHGSTKVEFKKPSVYLGKQVEFFRDSRIPINYYITKCKMKDGFNPSIIFKIGADAAGLGLVKKLRAFTASRMKNIVS